MKYFALALGTVTKNRDGKIIEAFFPEPQLEPSEVLSDALAGITGHDGQSKQAVVLTPAQLFEFKELISAFDFPKTQALVNGAACLGKELVAVLLAQDTQPETVAECYLKLQMLSHRLVKPHQINLDGVFGVLPNVAWTSEGAIDVAELADRQIQARLEGRVLSVDSIDKFPKMSDYVVPAGVRIADAARVRLGAYVGEGTTVMHEGFINFNAGTEGVSMIEGRVSAGVMVGKGSDVGGGASIMGTLSGGGKMVISIGEQALLGANAGLGIPLGDRSTVEAGLYLTAGSKVRVLDAQGVEVDKVKARDLAGVSDLLFRRNSMTGQIECLANKSAVQLNEMLHSN